MVLSALFQMLVYRNLLHDEALNDIADPTKSPILREPSIGLARRK